MFDTSIFQRSNQTPPNIMFRHVPSHSISLGNTSRYGSKMLLKCCCIWTLNETKGLYWWWLIHIYCTRQPHEDKFIIMISYFFISVLTLLHNLNVNIWWDRCTSTLTDFVPTVVHTTQFKNAMDDCNIDVVEIYCWWCTTILHRELNTVSWFYILNIHIKYI